jgi:hypothetical protein
MNDEVLPAATALVGVVHARIDERFLDALAIDSDSCLVGVLLDNREQVREQPLLGRGQLRARRRGARPAGRRAALRNPIDGRARPDQRRGSRGRPQPLLGRSFALLRYRLPSSYRRA